MKGSLIRMLLMLCAGERASELRQFTKCSRRTMPERPILELDLVEVNDAVTAYDGPSFTQKSIGQNAFFGTTACNSNPETTTLTAQGRTTHHEHRLFRGQLRPHSPRPP